MLVPVAAFTWTDAAGALIALVSAIGARIKTTRDPAADVTLLVRHPRRWTLAHPYRALCRRLHSR